MHELPDRAVVDLQSMLRQPCDHATKGERGQMDTLDQPVPVQPGDLWPLAAAVTKRTTLAALTSRAVATVRMLSLTADQ